MAFYALNKYIGLRTWDMVPSAYYVRGKRDAIHISKDYFDVLTKCDSSHDLEKSSIIDELIKDKFIFECKEAEHPFSKWQYKICDNRYFPALNFMITSKCNYNCRHCFNAIDNNPLADEFTLDEAKKLLDEAEICGINAFTITGGEPMCHKDFFSIIEEIYKRKMYVEEINTNAYYINEETLDRLKNIKAFPLMKISYDGIGYHDWMRNAKGADKRTLDAIKLCVNKGFRVKIQTNVNKYNFDSMVATIKLMDNLGVEKIRLIRTTQTPRWNRNSITETFDFKEYFDAMLSVIDELLKENGLKIGVDIWNFLELSFKNKTFAIAKIQKEYSDLLPICKGNRGMVAIAANGNLYPCLQMSGTFDAKGVSFGNVKKDGLQKHLKGGIYMDMVCTTVKELADKNEKCKNCEYFKYCCGGCRALSLSSNGDYLGVDPSKCIFFSEGYYEKIIEKLKGWENYIPIRR